MLYKFRLDVFAESRPHLISPGITVPGILRFESWTALTPAQKAAAQQMIHAMRQN